MPNPNIPLIYRPTYLFIHLSTRNAYYFHFFFIVPSGSPISSYQRHFEISRRIQAEQLSVMMQGLGINTASGQGLGLAPGQGLGLAPGQGFGLGHPVSTPAATDSTSTAPTPNTAGTSTASTSWWSWLSGHRQTSDVTHAVSSDSNNNSSNHSSGNNSNNNNSPYSNSNHLSNLSRQNAVGSPLRNAVNITPGTFVCLSISLLFLLLSVISNPPSNPL